MSILDIVLYALQVICYTVMIALFIRLWIQSTAREKRSQKEHEKTMEFYEKYNAHTTAFSKDSNGHKAPPMP